MKFKIFLILMLCCIYSCSDCEYVGKVKGFYFLEESQGFNKPHIVLYMEDSVKIIAEFNNKAIMIGDSIFFKGNKIVWRR